jgi:hypothetical protein
LEVLRRAAIYLPVLLGLLVMLPRLISPRFGLFDDGRVLVTAEKMAHGTWYTGADSIEGRFRPIHWLWFTLSYLVDGPNPLWFYVANTLALLTIIGGLIFLVRAAGGSRLQAGLTGLVFILSGPIMESFMSLKGEVIQLTLIVISLLAVLSYAHARNIVQKIAAIVLIVFVLTLAYLTKETALVLLPISLVWYLLARFWPGYEKEPRRRAARAAYLIANLLAAPLFFLLRKVAISAQISGGTYSGQYAIRLDQLSVSALRWAGWLVRDFVWVVPLVVLAMIVFVSQRRLKGRCLLIDAFVWMGAWICIYLPWTFMAEYYMLPFALGLAVFVSACVVETVQTLQERGWRQWVSVAFLSSSLVLLVGALLNNLTNARVQLEVDDANANMRAYLVENTKPGSTVLVNIQDPNEYFYEMQTQLGEVYGRPDLKVEVFSTDTTLAGDAPNMYIVSPYVVNQPLLTVRMGVIEETQQMWNDSLREFMRGHPGWQIVFEPANRFHLTDVNYPRIFCPFVKTRAFCATPEPLVDTREFEYGWTIYRLVSP